MEKSLDKLFNPGSIAILGASEDLERIGGLTLHFLLRHGYPGRIYPVIPNTGRFGVFPAMRLLRTSPIRLI